MDKFNKFNDFLDKVKCPNCGSIMTVFYPAKYVCPNCRYKRNGKFEDKSLQHLRKKSRGD